MLRLELTGISKQYPAVRANDDIHLKVAPGQIHAVLGENGAGKSTLMKIIYGAVQPDEGEMIWNGKQVEVASPAQARALGISMVYQHFSLFDTLTAAENVWLGLDKSLPLAEVTERIRQVAAGYGLDVDPLRPVHTLSVGERQRVEIVRALLTNPQLLILDEPTSVLTPQAVEKLFVTLRKLSDEGCAILYISHKLDEIRNLCHHCTVLRGGKVTGEVDPTQETNASLAPDDRRRAAGADAPPFQRGRRGAVGQGPVAAAARSLRRLAQADRPGRAGRRDRRRGRRLRQRPAGADGRALRRGPPCAGRLGQPVRPDIAAASPARRAQGLHFVPEERLGRGAVPTLSLAQNTLLTRQEAVGSGGWLTWPPPAGWRPT
jgi:simple sugar transport system ATP-binding protein